jgi:hypothetical protein
MARALLGYVGSGIEQTLSVEIIRLRRRVAELEVEVTELRRSHRESFDHELHELSENSQHALA